MRPAVVHVGNDITGGDTGGIASVIRTLVATSPVPSIAVPTYWGRHIRPARLARSLVAVLSAPREAVVHCHLSEGGSWLREGSFVLAGRLSGHSVAVSLHGALLDEWVTAHRWARALVAFVLRSASIAFVLHDDHARLVRRLSTVPVAVVANPVEPSTGSGAGGRPARAADTQPPTVVFLGVRDRRKGLDVLAEAWPRIRRGCPGARLVVAGPPGDVDIGGPGVDTVGPLPAGQARELLRAATLVVLPSRAEALPMVLLEAMAEGVPFVASAVAGIPRLAGTGAGVLVAPGHAEELARAVIRLLGEPALRADAGRAGRAWVRAHATPQAVHRHLLDRYGGNKSSRRRWGAPGHREPTVPRVEAS